MDLILHNIEHSILKYLNLLEQVDKSYNIDRAKDST